MTQKVITPTDSITYKIIGACIDMHNDLGPGHRAKLDFVHFDCPSTMPKNSPFPAVFWLSGGLLNVEARCQHPKTCESKAQTLVFQCFCVIGVTKMDKVQLSKKFDEIPEFSVYRKLITKEKIAKVYPNQKR